jgi:outer membrane biosynthesis protein TonB
MMQDDDAGEELLAGIDLHKWRVPPAPVVQRTSIVTRALAPVAAPKRRRIVWTVAAFAVANAAIAAIIAIVISRPAPQPTVTVLPAGAPADEQIQELLRQLDEEKQELQRRLAELDKLRAVVVELTEKLRRYEQRDKREGPKRKSPEPARSASCDEVSCVLTGEPAACCAKYKRTDTTDPFEKDGSGELPRNPFSKDVPEGLDRTSISAGIAAVKSRVTACGRKSSATGKVKVKIDVHPAGNVTNVVVVATPDAALGACVAGVIAKAKFARTQQGGSFSYPFLFASEE